MTKGGVRHKPQRDLSGRFSAVADQLPAHGWRRPGAPASPPSAAARAGADICLHVALEPTQKLDRRGFDPSPPYRP
jgi:hypothetical protein